MKRFLWVFTFLFIFLIALGNFFICQMRLQNTLNQTRQRLMLIASNAALSVSAEEIFKVPLEQRSEGTAEYMAVYDKLVKIKEANPAFVKYVYIMTTTAQPGILQYVVDADPVPQIITAHCPTSLPGDKYDARALPELLNAYDSPSADKKITSDVWGAFISGYAPIRDIDGKPVAILGVDSDATSIQLMQKNVKTSLVAVLVAGFLFAASFLTLIKYS